MTLVFLGKLSSVWTFTTREVAATALSKDAATQRGPRGKCGLGGGGSYMGELEEKMSSGTGGKARVKGTRTGDR